MLSIGKAGRADYYLERVAVDPADYYLGAGEAPGRWVGAGSAVLGLSGEVTGAELRALLTGEDPRDAGADDSGGGGERLVSAVMRADPRGKLPSRPLLRAVEELAGERGLDVERVGELAGEGPVRGALERDLARARRSAGVGVDRAEAICVAAGLDVGTVYGEDRVGRARRFAGRKVDARVPAFDLTFSAPKSVSVLYALGGEGVAGHVRRAHDAAVVAAMGYMEDAAAFTRRGRCQEELTRVRSDGLVAAAFPHRTSRADDPQLHTHVVVANLARTGDDGVWRSLDGAGLYRHAKAAGALYQAHLRDELTRRLGVEWEPVRSGCAEVSGVPRPVIDTFSKRRAEITARLAVTGGRTAAAAETAALDTRRAKSDPCCRDGEALRDGWAREAAAVGFERNDVERLLGRVVHLRADSWRAVESAARLVGPGGLTAASSTFDRRDVIRAFCEELPAGAPVDRVLLLTDALLAGYTGAVVRLDPPGQLERPGERLGERPEVTQPEVAQREGSRPEGSQREGLWASAGPPGRDGGSTPDGVPEPGGGLDRLSGRDVLRRADGRVVPAAATADEPRYTTFELLAVERRLLTRAVAGRGVGVARAGEDLVGAVLAARPGIDDGQAAMVRQLTLSGDRVDVVVGRAGTGKTYALETAARAWAAAGVAVTGCALAGAAADELQAAAGIDAYTIASLLARTDPDRPGPPGAWGLPAGGVLIVDEAGMVGTRALDALLDRVERAGGKLVLVGDHRQLPEIDTGGAFRGLVERLPGAVELTVNHRQRDPADREAADGLRHGDVAAAVEALSRRGRLVVGETASGVRGTLVADWWAARGAYEAAGRAGEDAGVMLALRRDDVADLNARARALMADAGLLTGPALPAGGREFRAGDRAVCVQGDPRLGVRNRTRGTVAAVDVQAGTATLRRDDGRPDVTLPREYLDAGRLDHGYALTGHKAQGATVDHAWCLGSDAVYREWGYVALSRHRETATFYVVDHARAEHTPLGTATPGVAACAAAPDVDRSGAPGEADVERVVTEWLSRSRGRTLALDQGTPWPADPRLVDPLMADELRDLPAEALAHSQRAAREAVKQAGIRADVAARDVTAAEATHAGLTRDLAWQEQRLATATEGVDRLEARPGGFNPWGRRREEWRTELTFAQAELLAAERAVLFTRDKLAKTEQRVATAHEQAAGQAHAARDVAGRLVVSHATVSAVLDERVERAARDRLRVAEHEPPGYLTDVLGSCPPATAGPAARETWRRAVRAVEAYRERWGVADLALALGAELDPGSPDAAAQRTVCHELVEELRGAQRELAALGVVHLDPERDRDLGRRPDRATDRAADRGSSAGRGSGASTTADRSPATEAAGVSRPEPGPKPAPKPALEPVPKPASERLSPLSPSPGRPLVAGPLAGESARRVEPPSSALPRVHRVEPPALGRSHGRGHDRDSDHGFDLGL